MVCLCKIWKTFLLSLEGIGREILEMLALLLDLVAFWLILDLFPEVLVLNCKAIHCLNDLLSLLAVSLSQPDLEIDEIKS